MSKLMNVNVIDVLSQISKIIQNIIKKQILHLIMKFSEKQLFQIRTSKNILSGLRDGVELIL